MFRSMIAPLSVGFLAFAMVLITLQLFQMDMFNHIKIASWFDQMEELPAEEMERRAAIRRLPINEEKQMTLINKQVFLGAGRHMVVYAIGQPKRRKDLRANGGDAIEAWVFHFSDDYQPTVLEFDQNALIKAYKASLGEVENLGTEIPVSVPASN